MLQDIVAKSQAGWEPTNTDLWLRIQKLARGEVQEFKSKGATFYAPRRGEGFKEASPKALSWCVRVYNLVGGRWRKPGVDQAVLLNGNMVEKVVARHQTKLAKMLGDEVRQSMCRYQDAPSMAWKSCAGCSHWVTTAATDTKTRPGVCLKSQFKTIELGWCPGHQEI